MEGRRHPERRRLTAGAKDLPLIQVMGHEIPPPAGESAGLRDDAGRDSCRNWMSRMNVWKLREGVILSAGVSQPERRISLRPAVADHRSITTDAVLSDKAAIAMRSLCPLVKPRAFGMTQVEIAVEIWMSRMNVWKLREGVILSAGVCQPERTIPRSSELWAMRSLGSLVKTRAPRQERRIPAVRRDSEMNPFAPRKMAEMEPQVRSI